MVLRGRRRRTASGRGVVTAGRQRLGRAGGNGGTARARLRRPAPAAAADARSGRVGGLRDRAPARASGAGDRTGAGGVADRKSTRLNSSHSQISYAVFCLKKKNVYITTLLVQACSEN